MESGRDRATERGQVQNQVHVHQVVALVAAVCPASGGEREVIVVQVPRTVLKDEANEPNSHRHQQKDLAAGKLTEQKQNAISYMFKERSTIDNFKFPL